MNGGVEKMLVQLIGDIAICSLSVSITDIEIKNLHGMKKIKYFKKKGGKHYCSVKLMLLIKIHCIK